MPSYAGCLCSGWKMKLGTTSSIAHLESRTLNPAWAEGQFLILNVYFYTLIFDV
jgi:hypothetical protein